MGYFLEYDLNEIKNLDKDEQIQIMKNWFLSNYQDPQNECPYDKEEGDYVYIYGGPYNAMEELNDEFGDYVNEEIIKELADELENDCYEWSGIYLDYEEYDEIEISKIEPLSNLKHCIKTLEQLLEIEYNENFRETIYNMITANCITILEAFLSEYLLSKVLNDNILIRKAIENIDDFKDRKISIDKIFLEYEQIKITIKVYFSNLNYHNLPKISKIYELIFDKKFPKNIGGIYRMIEYRHDIIHRNGKNKEGVKIRINKEDIIKLIKDILSLAEYIDDNTMPDYKF